MSRLPALGVGAKSLCFSVFLSVSLLSLLSFPQLPSDQVCSLCVAEGGAGFSYASQWEKACQKPLSSLATHLEHQGMDSKPSLESTS